MVRKPAAGLHALNDAGVWEAFFWLFGQMAHEKCVRFPAHFPISQTKIRRCSGSG